MRKRIFLIILPVIAIIALILFKNSKTPLLQNWVRLERDTSGYVFYSPCEDIKEDVDIKGNQLIRGGGDDDPDTLKILSTTRLTTGKYEIKCKGKYYGLLINIRWLDNAHTTALWKFHYDNKNYPADSKAVMCPADKKAGFKVVKCVTNDSVKTAEMQFLPIEEN
jgi:hypothetical protein